MIQTRIEQKSNAGEIKLKQTKWKLKPTYEQTH
jgi:hypothetical protein